MNHWYTVLHPLRIDVVLFKGLDILTQITCGELKKSWLLKESANEPDMRNFLTRHLNVRLLLFSRQHDNVVSKIGVLCM